MHSGRIGDHERIWNMSTTAPSRRGATKSCGGGVVVSETKCGEIWSLFFSSLSTCKWSLALTGPDDYKWTRRPPQLYRSRRAEVRDDTEKACADQPRSHAAALRPTNDWQVQREDPHTDYPQWVLRQHDSLQLERLSQLHSLWESRESRAGKSPRADLELRNGRVPEESPIQEIHPKVEGRTGPYLGSLEPCGS